MKQVHMIVAVDSAGGFAKDGKIPWNIPEDMKHFQQVTKDSICIMGRKTYTDMLNMWHDRQAKKDVPLTEADIKSILPNRQCYVVTSDTGFNCPGATIAPGITWAISDIKPDDIRKVFIIGGARMYIEGMSHNPTIHMTVITKDYECDTFFPIDIINSINTKYNIVAGEQHDGFSFLTYKHK